jgi:hypothetical protein
MIIALNNWLAELIVCILDPLSSSVELPVVMVPLVRLTLPPTVHVFDPIKIDGTPVEDLKLMFPDMVIAGLLAEQSKVSAPAPVV